MLKAFSTPGNRTRTLVFLTVCAALAVAAGFVGIDDNPPGLILAYLAGVALTLAFAHPWRSPRTFRRLLYAAVGGFAVAAILHNVFYALGTVPDLPRFAEHLFEGGHVFFFGVALFLCPPAFLVGAVGAVVLGLRRSEA